MAQTPTTPDDLSPDERILYDIGVQDGKTAAKKELLTLLEGKYMNKELAVNSTEAQAILKLASNIAKEYRVGH